ncbi:Indole-3-acetic acid-induced protein ARG2 [Hibiscus syriacus]|uniref:Indole-3-acetic acid-induced protein ARG2 n=1 Tax=Hibiscus syriacus TaxID=106335 RepID=A0A6A2XEU1_HIBSY|nr:protein SENESCENCE-ASSOCIATED GENE 21, mitochondrial-like [Hibiscus syriacus]KAE8660606.1 Indole-3-acetic acid-induced protein ARG2 [Hibiscus syriacus]
MARSFSNAKLFSTFVVDGISNVISRRGYAAVSQGIVSSGIREGAGRSAAAVVKEEMEGGAKEKVSWVPDPVTGCYRPENSSKEIDVAELRAMLLKKN